MYTVSSLVVSLSRSVPLSSLRSISIESHRFDYVQPHSYLPAAFRFDSFFSPVFPQHSRDDKTHPDFVACVTIRLRMLLRRTHTAAPNTSRTLAHTSRAARTPSHTHTLTNTRKIFEERKTAAAIAWCLTKHQSLPRFCFSLSRFRCNLFSPILIIYRMRSVTTAVSTFFRCEYASIPHRIHSNWKREMGFRRMKGTNVCCSVYTSKATAVYGRTDRRVRRATY